MSLRIYYAIRNFIRSHSYEMQDVCASRDDEICATYEGRRLIIGPFYIVFARRTHVHHD